MPPISIMIKPASGNCNMNCSYCFYKDEMSKRETKSYGIMTIDTLESIIKNVLGFADKECTIAFQGGEPTLAGLGFYRQLIEIQNRYNTKKVKIYNAIQTNGYKIDEEWAKFFAENQFLVGLSFDGIKDVHDRYRIIGTGEGTYNHVLRTVQLFKKHKVEFNILTVVTAHTVRYISKIYGFFQRNELIHQQYIPCLDPIGEERGKEQYSLTPDLYLEFLKKLFDLWYLDIKNDKEVHNRYFENLLEIMVGGNPKSCGMAGVCSRQFVIEADGSVYPCDFYALDQWRLGNFATDSVEIIEKRREELEFIQSSENVHEDCIECKWYLLCRGGCRRDRELSSGKELWKNYYCKAYFAFYEYAYPRLWGIINR